MLQPISQTDHAFRDTLITKAEGDAFDRLAQMWGWPRLGSFSVAAWRKGLHGVALGPRPCPGALHTAIDGVLSGGVLPVAVTVAAANPDRITAAAGAPFAAGHVGRLVRVAGQLYYSTSFAPTFLTLATMPTALWAGANWAAGGAFTAEILPYIYHDGARPGELHIFSDAVGRATPPTYLLDNGAAHPGAPRPMGGHLLPGGAGADDPATGPWPLYLSSTALGELAERISLLMAAGNRAQAWAADWENWSMTP